MFVGARGKAGADTGRGGRGWAEGEALDQTSIERYPGKLRRG